MASHGGELTPGQLAAAARASGLDFIAVTEHNTAGAHGAWGQLAGNDLLAIPGQEVVTGTGHWLALGTRPGQVTEWRYGVRDGVIGRHVSEVRAAGGLCVAAHPHAPYPGGVFMYPLDGFDAVEVWNGLWASDRPWNADNGAATAEWGRSLAAGVHFPPGGRRRRVDYQRRGVSIRQDRGAPPRTADGGTQQSRLPVLRSAAMPRRARRHRERRCDATS